MRLQRVGDRREHEDGRGCGDASGGSEEAGKLLELQFIIMYSVMRSSYTRVIKLVVQTCDYKGAAVVSCRNGNEL